MLPYVKTAKTAALGAITALALAAGAAQPALAWGKNEQNFLKGVAAALIVDAIIDNQRDVRRLKRQQSYAPTYAPVTRQTYYDDYVPRTSIYSTPAAQAFNAYSLTERRAIQRRLAAYGYYRSGIDGSFGPGTYNAIVAYARDAGRSDRLNSRNGALGLYDGLIY